MPAECGIDVNEIPTYIWYMKPNKSHGARFMVCIDNIKWKTTSSKKISLRYKFEEAKLFLRQLKEEKPEIFEDYSMNGDYTKLGKKLLKSYYDIIHLANYDHIRRYNPQNRTVKYLKSGKIVPGYLSSLSNKKFNFKEKKRKNRRALNRLPKKCGIKSEDLPKYCYYIPASKTRSSSFIIKNHPKLLKKKWQTTTSKKVPIQEKYQQLLDYLANLK